MPDAPLIGVTGPEKGGLMAWMMTWLALRRAGARPVRLMPSRIADAAALDGVVLGGGSDIDPQNYGQELLVLKADASSSRLKHSLAGLLVFVLRVLFSRKTGDRLLDHERDAMEIGLCRYMLAARRPVLGICRGSQLINIVLGGTLHQHTHTFYTETPHIRSVLPRRRIHLLPDSRLQRILQMNTCRVNSLHDQAVNRLGNSLVAAAVDRNHIVQAVEHTRHPFLIGVQWHPEYLPQSHTQQKLFAALVAVAQQSRKSAAVGNSRINM